MSFGGDGTHLVSDVGRGQRHGRVIRPGLVTHPPGQDQEGHHGGPKPRQPQLGVVPKLKGGGLDAYQHVIILILQHMYRKSSCRFHQWNSA